MSYTRSPRRVAARPSFARLAALATLAALGGCTDFGPVPQQPAGDAHVRFLNAVPGIGSVSLAWNGETAATSIAFGSLGTTASYVALAAGERRIAVRTSGGEQLIGGAMATTIGRAYTLALIRRDAAYDLAVLVDTNTTPVGKATLRFVHVARSLAALDIYVTAPGADLAAAEPLEEPLRFGQTSGYVVVDPGTHQLRLTTALEKTLRLDAGSVTVAAGQVRTIVVLDPAVTGEAPQSLLLTDRN